MRLAIGAALIITGVLVCIDHPDGTGNILGLVLMGAGFGLRDRGRS